MAKETEAYEISRLERADTLGLAFLRTVILLNGGGILAMLTYLGNSSAQTATKIELSAIKHSTTLFLLGITVILLGLIVSYAFIGSPPQTKVHELLNKHIVKINSGAGIVSVIAFFSAVFSLICGATTT